MKSWQSNSQAGFIPIIVLAFTLGAALVAGGAIVSTEKNIRLVKSSTDQIRQLADKFEAAAQTSEKANDPGRARYLRQQAKDLRSSADVIQNEKIEELLRKRQIAETFTDVELEALGNTLGIAHEALELGVDLVSTAQEVIKKEDTAIVRTSRELQQEIAKRVKTKTQDEIWRGVIRAQLATIYERLGGKYNEGGQPTDEGLLAQATNRIREFYRDRPETKNIKEFQRFLDEVVGRKPTLAPTTTPTPTPTLAPTPTTPKPTQEKPPERPWVDDLFEDI